MRKFNKLFILFLLISFSSFIVVAKQKMTPEEIIAKHLESISKAESRNSIKNQLALGDAEAVALRNGGVIGKGKVVIASELNKFIIGMEFPNPNYPFEKIGFDGNTLKIADVTQNTRSPLGSFIASFNEIITEGLLGGSLTNAWSLLRLNEKNAKLESKGTKKVNGKEAYVISYEPKGGTQLEFILLFFDKNTFQHVRTEYRKTLAAGISGNQSAAAAQGDARINNSSRENLTRYLLSEDFSDFKTDNNMTLPHSYKLNYNVESNRGTSQFEWRFKINQFYFNQDLEESSFDIDAKQ